MTLRLRDTLTRQIEPVEPLEPGRLRMYTCGPTVYRYAHVGNLRSFMLADLIRRVALYHGLEVLHVKNVTDVGHLRDEGFDRGRGPDARPGRARVEDRSRRSPLAYEAAFHADEAAVNILPAHVFPRATEHIAEMIGLAEALEDAGHAYATPEGNVYYAVATLPGLRAALRQQPRPSCGPATGARSSRTSATRPTSPSGRAPARAACSSGRRRAGATASPAGTSSARRWRCATWGASSTSTPAASTTSFPHHEDEIAQSAADQRPDPGAPLGPWRVPAGRRPQDGQVGRQLPAHHRARRPRPRSARLPVPGPDLEVRPQARVLGPIDCGRRQGARVAARADCARSARRRSTGRGAAPPPLVAGSAGDRPDGIAAGPAGHGDGRGYVPARPCGCPGRSPVPRRSRASTIGSSRPSMTTWTCPPPWRSSARSSARRCRPTNAAGWSSTPTSSWGSTSIASGRRRPAGAAEPCWGGSGARLRAAEALLAERTAARAAHDYVRADRLRDDLAGLGWDVVDEPAGSRLERRERTR